MSLHAAATYDCERISTAAHRARTTQNSRHTISELAFELLQGRQHSLHHVKIGLSQRLMISAEQQHSVDAAALASKHDQEIAGLEDTKFALFEEFDARRAALAGTMGKLMTEASLMHTKAVKELITQSSRTASELQSSHFITTETSTARRERYYKQAERRASLEKDLKLRQLQLNKQHRPARTEIENEYQVRLGELQQRREVFQKRQANELKILAN